MLATSCFMNQSAIARMVLTAMLATSTTALAVPITIDNGDFSLAANTGSIGGGLVSLPTQASIGAGPWSGTYQGVLALLAAPNLSIGGGKATISNLFYTSALGLNANNAGSFKQTLSASITPNRRYVLQADVNAGSALNLDILGSGNAGIALLSGSTTLASSRSDAGSGVVSLEVLSGTTYRVKLSYDSPANASGQLSVALLAEPQGVVTANLLGSVSFDNVRLDEGLIVQTPSSLQLLSPEVVICTVGETHGAAVELLVRDALGDPISGIIVNYSAPSTGASLFPATGTVTTNNLGIATFTPLANTIAGTYDVNVTVPATSVSAVITMTNRPGPAAQIGTMGNGVPTTVVGMTFTEPVGVRVLDQYGNGVSGTTVSFSAPTSGPGATPSAPSTASSENGIAAVMMTANTVAGDYSIGVSVPSISASATVPLRNLAGAPAQIGPPSSSVPQGHVGQPLSAPVAAKVQDQYGNPVSGAVVGFSAPGSGPSATLSSATATTDQDGIARVNAIANMVAGDYTIATHSGAADGPVALRNLLPTDIGIKLEGVPGQSADINSLYHCLLLVRATDAFQAPQPALLVDFEAPASGPSALLRHGETHGISLRIPTDVDGFAWVEATGNGIPGTYVVTATLAYSTTSAVSTFRLQNLAPGDAAFGSGFDGLCARADR